MSRKIVDPRTGRVPTLDEINWDYWWAITMKANLLDNINVFFFFVIILNYKIKKKKNQIISKNIINDRTKNNYWKLIKKKNYIILIILLIWKKRYTKITVKYWKLHNVLIRSIHTYTFVVSNNFITVFMAGSIK